MKKAYVFLADGFEEIEGLTVVDVLRRAGVRTETVSVMETKKIDGAHGIKVEADLLFEEAEAESADMIVLPGGMPGTVHLGEHQRLAELLQSFAASDRKVAAICAAPSVLGGLGILKNKKAACYPGFEEKLEGAQVFTDPVVKDGNITTSRGVGTAISFALELISQLEGEVKARQIKKSIVS